MASTYVNDLRLNEMATGDGSGTWGTTTNTNLELIAEAFSYGTEVITTNADTHTTTIADGATDPGRSMYLKYTGTLDSACTITIGPNTVSKVWIVENGTSGSQDIILSQGSGANITIPAGDTKVVYSDGAGAGAAFFDAFASLNVVDLKVQDDLTVTDAALVTGVLTTTATQVATGGITSGSDIISDTDSTDSLGSTGVRWLKGWFDTLTAGTLTVGSGSVTDSSGAISFGDENLTTTGIVTAAGTSVFTNLDISGDVDVDGTTNLDVVDIDGAVDMASTALVTGVLTANGGAVFNETGADVDFRVESDTVDHALFVQGSDGFVGIGTSSPVDLLHVKGTTSLVGDYQIVAEGGTGGYGAGISFQSPLTGGSLAEMARITADGEAAWDTTAANQDAGLRFYTALDGTVAERVRVTAAGNVGIGITSPASALHVKSTGSLPAKFEGASHSYTQWLNSTGTAGYIGSSGGIGSGSATDLGVRSENNLIFLTNAGTERMRISTAGDVGVGISPPQAKFHVNQTTINEMTGYFYNNTATNASCLRVLQDGAGSSGPALLVRQDGSGNAITVDSATDGNTVFSVSNVGALSKASGSFKINHPLEAKTDTHHLIHSFIEGPQADNIYRGKVDLVAGSATANIDTVAGMTEGTFVALNREVQCFTTNESNWDAVKGSVSGNILTIESENSESTATISWLVIGERQDQHMYDTDWTDENGKVIVEPLKD
jgi:hypothetical protein